MQQQFEQLKCNQSLQLEEDMPVLWPKSHEPAPFKVSNILKTVPVKHKAYAYAEGNIIAFICHGELFVTPYTTKALGIVQNAGYKLYEFHVPFSSGARPQGELGEKWQALIANIKPTAKIMRTQAATA